MFNSMRSGVLICCLTVLLGLLLLIRFSRDERKSPELNVEITHEVTRLDPAQVPQPSAAIADSIEIKMPSAEPSNPDREIAQPELDARAQYFRRDELPESALATLSPDESPPPFIPLAEEPQEVSAGETGDF